MFKVWDADGHVEESEATFSDKYWDPELKDRRPFVVETDPSGNLAWVIDSHLFPNRHGTHQFFGGTPASKDGVTAPIHRVKVHDPIESAEFRSAKARLAQMDHEGIAFQVNYPTMFLSWPLGQDARMGGALARAYNNWVADISSGAPDRLKWVTIVDMWDPAEAAREIYRTKEMGSAGVMLLGTFGHMRLDNPSVEHVWAAAAETGLPVAVHVGAPSPTLGSMFDSHSDATTVPLLFSMLIGFHRVMAKGILDKYPSLKVAFLEGSCQWVPLMMERVEEYSGKPGTRAGARIGYKSELLPEEYVKRGQVFFGFEVEDALLPFVTERYGNDCWVYGSDIPHVDRLYKASDLLQQRTDLTEETKRKLLIDNVAKFYGLPVPEPEPAAG